MPEAVQLTPEGFPLTYLTENETAKSNPRPALSLMESGQRGGRAQRPGAQTLELGGQGPGADTVTPTLQGRGPRVLTVRESPRAATTWMSAGLRVCTGKTDRHTRESVGRKLPSESRATCFQQEQAHDPRVCLGRVGLSICGSVEAEGRGKQLPHQRHNQSTWTYREGEVLREGRRRKGRAGCLGTMGSQHFGASSHMGYQL